MMAFLVWALLACSAVFWSLQLFAKPLPTPADALAVREVSGPRADLSRLLGAAPVAAAQAAPVADARFSLLGLVAPRNAGASREGEGVALIAVDGVPRTVRIGALVDGELRLLALDARSAGLGAGGVVSMTLVLAPPQEAATGSLPPAQPSATVLGGQPQGVMPPPAPYAPATLPPPSVDSSGLPTR